MRILERWVKEIQKVGFKDWFWFVVILERNEFHARLSLWKYYKKYGRGCDARLVRDRNRAHKIDLELNDTSVKRGNKVWR